MILDYYRKLNAVLADSLIWAVSRVLILGLAGLIGTYWMNDTWSDLYDSWVIGAMPWYILLVPLGLQICVLTTIFRAGEMVDLAHSIWKARR